MCIYLSRGYQIYANKIIYKANVKRNIYSYALFLLFQCLEPKRMTLILCGYLKIRSTLEKCHHHPKKNAIFFTIFIFGNIRIRISATMDFCLHFSRSTAVDIFVKIFCISKRSFVIAPEVSFINR